MLYNSDDVWIDLLEHIEDRRVIPIIGQELVTVGPPDSPVLLYDWIAERLAERLRLPARDFDHPPTLNDVVCRYLSETRGRKEDIYPKIRAILKDQQFETPPLLRKLASIPEFDLFISLTFDPLLKQAIDEVRYPGAAKTEVFSYAPNSFDDISSEKYDMDDATVFHLLGKLSASPDYVITEEDILEFIYSMQSDARRPQLLFDELKNNHLLLLGCNFSGWLARFFIRAAKSQQLSAHRGETEIFVGNELNQDNGLVMFLQNFSYNTKIVESTPAEFVDEMVDRLKSRNVVQAAVEPPNGGKLVDPGGFMTVQETPSASMPPGAIFISYASENTQQAQALKDAFDAQQIDAWLDKQELEAGDEYELKIRRNIKACSYFIPLISQASTRRKEGFFIREWKWAVERASSIAEGVPFILPVVIDDTPIYNEEVPMGFQQVQWTNLPEGVATPEFLLKLIQLVREYHKRVRS